MSTLGYTITEFIDNRIDNFFSNRELYKLSPFNLEDLRDCILLEIIKDAYDEAEKKQSIRANRGSDADDLRMRDSRSMKYAQHYRSLQYEHILETTGAEVKELLPDDVSTMDGKLDGHKISGMQYFELNTISDIPLLKAIVNKRICDVKSISNDVFIAYMDEYQKFIDGLIGMLDGDDEDVIFATIALFTLEWKYQVELFYQCAVEAEKHKTKEIPIERIGLLCAELPIPVHAERTIIHTESRFVMHRLEIVPHVYEDKDQEWDEIKEKFFEYFIAKYYIEREIVHKWSLPEYFVTHIDRSKWADFFREHYDLRKIYKPKEWNNFRIRYVRNIYKAMIKEMPKPKL